MDSTVAIVAISSAATLLAAAIGAAASQVGLGRQTAAESRRQSQQQQHERVLRDMGELRSVLDEAAQVLRELRVEVRRPAGPGWVERGLTALEPLYARMLVRLGPDNDACNAVESALDAFREIEALYRDVEPFSTEDDEDEFWDTLDLLRDQVEHQETRFVAAATATAGARLEISS